MTKDEKIDIIMILSNEVNIFIDEVKKFIPSLLLDRYKSSDISHADILISILEIEQPKLKNLVKKVYNKHMTDIELDDLMILCEFENKVEIKQSLYDALEDVKDFWFDAFIFKIDIIMDKLENVEFSN